MKSTKKMNEYLRELLTRLANQGLKARFVAHPDACSTCRKLHGRILEPLEAPSIPVRGCLSPPCRCRYEGCDLRPAVASLLTAGIAAVEEQRLQEAKELLYQVIDLDERNEKAWLWLSGVVEGIDERIVCLENVLAINPDREVATEGLNHLLAQRREVGPGQAAARKIKVAREAIGDIRARQEKIATLKGKPPAAISPPREELAREHVAERPPVKEPVESVKEERLPTRPVAMGFLYVLLAVLILVLVLAALTYTGVL